MASPQTPKSKLVGQTSKTVRPARSRRLGRRTRGSDGCPTGRAPWTSLWTVGETGGHEGPACKPQRAGSLPLDGLPPWTPPPQGKVAWSKIRSEEDRKCRSGENSMPGYLIQGMERHEASCYSKTAEGSHMLFFFLRGLLEPSCLIEVREN